LFENQNIPSPSYVLEEDSDFHEIGSFDDWLHADPFVFECVMSEGLGIDYARAEFNVRAPPSVIKDEPYATNEVSMSDYSMFVRVVQPMPPVDDIECNFDLGVEFSSGSSDGAHYKFFLYADHADWSHLMVKKRRSSSRPKRALLGRQPKFFF